MIDTASALVALAAMAFQWGYRPADDGSMEYMIQLSPGEVQHLAGSPGVEFTSEVPDEAQPVGRIRISVGDGALPRSTQPSERPGEGPGEGDAVLALHDAGGRPVAEDREAPAIRETQSRIPKARSGEESADGLSQDGDLGDLDKDLAGRLVPIPAGGEPARVAERPAPLQLSMQDGSPPASKEAQPTADEEPGSRQDAADENPADLAAAELPEGLSQPVYTTNKPVPDHEPVRREISPSDQPDNGPEATAGQPRSAEADEDRPWLPLVGAIAAACGFLAGNVFQWRSYLSLRKRYLHLLRKTGG